MEAVSLSNSPTDLLAHAEELVARLVEATEAADWTLAGELDRSLALALHTLSTALGAANAAERHAAAQRLLTVRTRHTVATNSLRAARDSVRAELADVAHGRRGIKSYMDSAAG